MTFSPYRPPLLGLVLATLIALLSGCNNPDSPAEGGLKEPQGAPTSVDLNLCTSPRPEMCTQEYNPVCATLTDGSRKTASTGCTACSDPNVVGWTPGECE